MLLILNCLSQKKKKTYSVKNEGYDVSATLIFNWMVFFKYCDNLFHFLEFLLSSYSIFFIIIISKYKNNVDKTSEHSSSKNWKISFEFVKFLSPLSVYIARAYSELELQELCSLLYGKRYALTRRNNVIFCKCKKGKSLEKKPSVLSFSGQCGFGLGSSRKWPNILPDKNGIC
jgi:hypothetical protein